MASILLIRTDWMPHANNPAAISNTRNLFLREIEMILSIIFVQIRDG